MESITKNLSTYYVSSPFLSSYYVSGIVLGSLNVLIWFILARALRDYFVHEEMKVQRGYRDRQ